MTASVAEPSLGAVCFPAAYCKRTGEPSLKFRYRGRRSSGVVRDQTCVIYSRSVHSFVTVERVVQAFAPDFVGCVIKSLRLAYRRQA